MNPERAALARRQQALLLRSAALRHQVADDLGRWHAPLAAADQAQQHAVQTWAWLRAHPTLPLAGALALVVWRPRRVLGWCWRWGRRAVAAKRLFDRVAGARPQRNQA